MSASTDHRANQRFPNAPHVRRRRKRRRIGSTDEDGKCGGIRACASKPTRLSGPDHFPCDAVRGRLCQRERLGAELCIDVAENEEGKVKGKKGRKSGQTMDDDAMLDQAIAEDGRAVVWKERTYATQAEDAPSVGQSGLLLIRM